MDNLTTCYCKKHIDSSFSRVCPVIDNEICHIIIKVVCGSTRQLPGGSWHSYFDNVIMVFMINNMTDA